MIKASDLATLLKTSTRHAVLDVRERAAHERGHIYRATSLPRRLLESRLPRLVTAPSTPIVLYDVRESGKRRHHRVARGPSR